MNTTVANLADYLAGLLKSTNMKCLTPGKVGQRDLSSPWLLPLSLPSLQALSGECGFMAANLYAKSIFGEDALANVSLEKNLAKPESAVTGHIR